MCAHLKRVIESVDGRGVHGTDHLQDTVEVIQLLKHLQDLNDPGHHGHALLQVLRLYDTPEGREESVRNSRA